MSDLTGPDSLSDSQTNYTVQNTINDNLSRGIGGRSPINFTTDANLTLSTTEGSDQWRDKFINFTDTSSPVVLTAGRDVIFPAKEGPEYIVENETAQTLTLKISGQTGVTVATTAKIRVYYDGTDMVESP